MKREVRVTFVMLGIVAAIAASCKKEDVVAEPVNATIKTSALTEMSASTSAPYLFNATAGSDVTVALQAALNANKVVQINKSYIISNTLVIPSGGTLTSGGLTTAVLKAASTRTGLLQTRGMYINISSKTAVSVSGIRFQPADNMTDLSAYANTAILIYNSSNCIVSGNTFDFSFAYTKGMSAVWITGPSSVSNTVSGNVIKTLGITYCENGASNNMIQNNQITNASANALSGIGNGATACTSNQVLNNIITNAGRMGIEDQQNTVGTIISGNTITGAGKSPAIATGYGMGISAVAKNTVVKSNKITDVRDYYIEVGGSNKLTVSNNTIFDTGKYAGIFVNFTANLATDMSKQTVIGNNNITGCLKAIVTFGSGITQYIRIDSNQITDPVTHGINIDAGSSVKSSYSINNNTITFNTKTAISRYGIMTYTRNASGQQNYTFTANRNTISYSPAAVLGTGYDTSLLVTFDYSAITYNTINGYAGGKNYGISSNGAVTKGVTLVGNIVRLATWNTAQYAK